MFRYNKFAFFFIERLIFRFGAQLRIASNLTCLLVILLWSIFSWVHLNFLSFFFSVILNRSNFRWLNGIPPFFVRPFSVFYATTQILPPHIFRFVHLLFYLTLCKIKHWEEKLHYLDSIGSNIFSVYSLSLVTSKIWRSRW